MTTGSRETPYNAVSGKQFVMLNSTYNDSKIKPNPQWRHIRRKGAGGLVLTVVLEQECARIFTLVCKPSHCFNQLFQSIVSINCFNQ